MNETNLFLIESKTSEKLSVDQILIKTADTE
jgi:hypothetical protein